jgi:hypothetical protein
VDLLTFVIAAKKATYVGDGAASQSSRNGSIDLTFEHGDWSYRDSYFGGTDFIGQETVWLKREPVWAMNYYGYILEPALISATEAGKVLKAALSQPQSQGRLIDNLKFGEGDMIYEIVSSGDVNHFKGRETISVDGHLAYALDYHGGLIKP